VLGLVRLGLPVIAAVARLPFHTGPIHDGTPFTDSCRGGSRRRGVAQGGRSPSTSAGPRVSGEHWVELVGCRSSDLCDAE
jgi:hypothetical protein